MVLTLASFPFADSTNFVLSKRAFGGTMHG